MTNDDESSKHLASEKLRQEQYHRARQIANQIKLSAQAQGVPREQFIEDMLGTLRVMEMSDSEVEKFYNAIVNRVRHKMCARCGKLKPSIGGDLQWVSGDMSQPKRFVCKECK